MREPQVVVALGHVIAELVGEAEAEAAGRAVGIDQVEPGELGLLAAVLREVRHGQRLAGPDDVRAVALVEPLGLAPGLARGRLAALEAFEEHPH